MTREEHQKIVDAVINAHKDNEMGGKYAKAFNHGVQSAFNRVCEALNGIEKQSSEDTLDKIRAEIIELRSKQNVGVMECLDIIDKYKVESEDVE